MRYTIETKDTGAINTINGLQRNEKIKIIDKGDPVEDMKSKLDAIKNALDTLKQSGISEELLVHFIHDKTKIGYDNIQQILALQKEFFQKLGIKIK